MRVQHKKLSGNIVISDYLEDFYKNSTNVINLPPLVDKDDNKWNQQSEGHKGTHFIYAGTPSSEKERLESAARGVRMIEKMVFEDKTVTDIHREMNLTITEIRMELRDMRKALLAAM
jgi:hypothetical protein